MDKIRLKGRDGEYIPDESGQPFEANTTEEAVRFVNKRITDLDDEMKIINHGIYFEVS
jgi:hypothetical protein